MYKGVCAIKYDMEENSVIICLLFLKESKLMNEVKIELEIADFPIFAVTLWCHHWRNQDDKIYRKFAYGLSISDVKLKLCWIFQNFENWWNFNVLANIFVGNVTRSLVYYPDSQEHSLCFEPLTETLAKISTKLRWFTILTFLKPVDVIFDRPHVH